MSQADGETVDRKTHSDKFDDLLREYDFDYGKSKPNRFAGRLSKNRVIVLLDPDEVFNAMPEGPQGDKRRS